MVRLSVRRYSAPTLTRVLIHFQRAKKEFFFHLYSWHNLDGLEQGGEESWDELFPTEKINVENHGPKCASPSLASFRTS